MGRVASLDYGLRRIGIAISDAGKKFALPLMTVEGGMGEVVEELRARGVDAVVIGLPLLMNGQKGEMAMAVEKFAKALEAALGVPVALLDERLSSKHADASLRETGSNRKQRTEKLDQVAASHLLQCYLDRLQQ